MTAETVLVRCAGGEYPVFCGRNVCSPGRLRELCTGTAITICDETVQNFFPEDVFADAVVIPSAASSEERKTLRTAEYIYDALAARMMRRDGTIVALGGGVVGDIAGFAAATYMRGVRLIQVPTTLLAQADAAVGGKTGVNHARGKNLIGAFYPPAAVFCDSRFLSSLPPREYRAGLAEVVKYALLGDAEFFGWLEENAAQLAARDAAAMQHAIVRSVRMKAEIVAADERETGTRRALLNLGHTFAHGLENAAGYGEWLHGEAVAAGLVAAAKLSVKLGAGFSSSETERVVALLQKFGLPSSFAGADADAVFRAMVMDKKRMQSEARFVLMQKIGAAVLREVCGEREVREVLEEMQ